MLMSVSLKTIIVSVESSTLIRYVTFVTYLFSLMIRD